MQVYWCCIVIKLSEESTRNKQPYVLRSDATEDSEIFFNNFNKGVDTSDFKVIVSH